MHDTDLSLKRGAELTINQLIAFGLAKGFRVETDLAEDFEQSKSKILASDFVIVASTSRCRFEKELLRLLIDTKIAYAKIEFDYNFCARRNIICTVDPSYKLCCDKDKFHLYRELFSKSMLIAFQSPRHFESHKEFFGEALQNVLIMPPTVEVDALKIAAKKDDTSIPFFGDLSFLKGARAFVAFASENPETPFIVYGKNKTDLEIPRNISFHDMIDNEKVLEILGRTKRFFCQPFWPEPSGRLAAEAFLSGCEIIGNDRIGTFSFDFYPNDIERAKKEMKETPEIFWNRIEQIIGKAQPEIPTLGKVLVKKSSGGLGDIFFCLPALKILKQAADNVSFSVESKLVNLLSQYVHDIEIIDRATTREIDFDTVIELGNYPAYMGGFQLGDALKYTTHKRIRQHAVQHYMDAVAKLHRDLNYQNVEFPYFEKSTDWQNPYFTVHPGAGFLLKTWPAERFAAVISRVRKRYPNLRCRIIVGPNEPEMTGFFDRDPKISIENGDLNSVAQTLKGAVFHIGNDSGITHFAEAFNIPTVGIYGPTGPGAWGSLSEKYETLWGKEGHCSLKCDYTVLVNCNDRVCLSSTTVEKVEGATLKLLQRLFHDDNAIPMLNPALEMIWKNGECTLQSGDSSLTVTVNNAITKANLQFLLAGNFDNLDSEMNELYALLRQHYMILTPPQASFFSAKPVFL